MRREFIGSIEPVREVEDRIRATKKYTKGIFSKPMRHPIQGEAFPSRMFTEYYEVYPGMEIGWDMPAGKAVDWLWGEHDHIDVLFQYDYRDNKAKVIVLGGDGTVKKLGEGIPGFADALAKVISNGHRSE